MVARSIEELFRHIATVGGDLREHSLVQPNIHLCRIPHEIRRAAQLCSQVLTRRETAIDLEQLQQVDDGSAPVQLLRISCRTLLQLRDDIDDRDRLGGGAVGTAAGLAAGAEVVVGVASLLPMPSFSSILLKNPMAISSLLFCLVQHIYYLTDT